MKICLKVLREAELVNDIDKFDEMTRECKELVAIVTSSIKTRTNK